MPKMTTKLIVKYNIITSLFIVFLCSCSNGSRDLIKDVSRRNGEIISSCYYLSPTGIKVLHGEKVTTLNDGGGYVVEKYRDGKLLHTKHISESTTPWP